MPQSYTEAVRPIFDGKMVSVKVVPPPNNNGDLLLANGGGDMVLKQKLSSGSLEEATVVVDGVNVVVGGQQLQNGNGNGPTHTLRVHHPEPAKVNGHSAVVFATGVEQANGEVVVVQGRDVSALFAAFEDFFPSTGGPAAVPVPADLFLYTDREKPGWLLEKLKKGLEKGTVSPGFVRWFADLLDLRASVLQPVLDKQDWVRVECAAKEKVWELRKWTDTLDALHVMATNRIVHTLLAKFEASLDHSPASGDASTDADIRLRVRERCAAVAERLHRHTTAAELVLERKADMLGGRYFPVEYRPVLPAALAAIDERLRHVQVTFDGHGLLAALWTPRRRTGRVVYVVRHAEPMDEKNYDRWNEMVANKDTRGLASDNCWLTDLGIQQAKMLKPWLQKTAPEVKAVVTSPYRRAMEVAVNMLPEGVLRLEPGLGRAPPDNDTCGASYESYEKLEELFGLGTDRPLAIDRSYQTVYPRDRFLEVVARSPRWDSFAAWSAVEHRCLESFQVAVERYLAEEPTLVLIGHSAFVGFITRVLTGQYLYGPHASVTKLEEVELEADEKSVIEGSRCCFRLAYAGDQAHLGGLLAEPGQKRTTVMTGIGYPV